MISVDAGGGGGGVTWAEVGYFRFTKELDGGGKSSLDGATGPVVFSADVDDGATMAEADAVVDAA